MKAVDVLTIINDVSAFTLAEIINPEDNRVVTSFKGDLVSVLKVFPQVDWSIDPNHVDGYEAHIVSYDVLPV